MTTIAPTTAPPLLGSFGNLRISTGQSFISRHVAIDQGPESTFRITDGGFGNPPMLGSVDAAKGNDLLNAMQSFVDANPSSPRPSGNGDLVSISMTWNGKQLGYTAPSSSMHPAASQVLEAAMLLANEAGPLVGPQYF